VDVTEPNPDTPPKLTHAQAVATWRDIDRRYGDVDPVREAERIWAYLRKLGLVERD
jgi:hypothetical protein